MSCVQGHKEGLTSAIKEAGRGLGNLLSAHIKLATTELAADIRVIHRRLLSMLVFVAMAVVGYALVMVAVALLLRRYIADGLAFFSVGALHLVIGGIGLYVYATRRPDKKLLATSQREIGTSADVIQSSTNVAILEDRTEWTRVQGH